MFLQSCSCLCASSMRQTYFTRRLSSLQMQTSQCLVEMFQSACKEKFSSLNPYKCDMHPADGRRKTISVLQKVFYKVFYDITEGESWKTGESRLYVTTGFGRFCEAKYFRSFPKSCGICQQRKKCVCVCSAARRLINVKNRQGLL